MKNILLLLLFSLLVIVAPVNAQTIDLEKVDEKKTVDKRTNLSPDNWHMLVFFARDRNPDVNSKTGHAYIAALTFRDDIQSFVADSVFGLYPSQGKEWILDYIDIDGDVDLSPADTDPDAALLVWVNKDVYQKALDIRDNWKKKGTWVLLLKDCVSMVGAVAEAAKLKKPGLTTVKPISYVKELMQLNE